MTGRAPPSKSERETVELVSAGASCAAADAPMGETLSDLGSPEPVRAALEGADPPEEITAAALFDRAEDGFVSALSVLLIPGEWRQKRRVAAIARPFGFVMTIKRRERVAVVAPSRFETDFASIPPAARWLISPFGRHAEAAVIHDWLYALGEPGDRAGRRRADRVFRAALKTLEVGFVLRSILHWSVRLGGGRSYGSWDESRFRRLSDLAPITPPPPKAPFERTFAVKPIPKAPRGGS